LVGPRHSRGQACAKTSFAWGFPAALYLWAAVTSPLLAKSLENTPWPCQNPLHCPCPRPCPCPCTCPSFTPPHVAASLPTPSPRLLLQHLHPLSLISFSTLRLCTVRSATGSQPPNYFSLHLSFTCSPLNFLNFYLQPHTR